MNQSKQITTLTTLTYISYHPFRILIIGGSGSSKTVSLLIKHERSDIEKIDLCVKYLFELKYQWFINGREKIGIKKLKHRKTFTDYLQTINGVYEDYNPA